MDLYSLQKKSRRSVFQQADAVFGGKAAKNKNRAEPCSASILRLDRNLEKNPDGTALTL